MKKQVTSSDKEKYLLEVIGLKKYFDLSSGWFSKKKTYLKAVDSVDLFIKEGETLGVVGESGCGKSTLANLIMRFLKESEGNIIFDGKDLTKLNEEEMRKIRHDIQIIFQDPFSSLNPRKRVFNIIAEPLRVHMIAKGKELEKRVFELMELVGLDPSYSRRFPHEVSGGQRQRIGIARALALRPKLIICDEPVSALDVSIQAQILNLLKDLQREFKLTYLFIGHGLPAVKHFSDRIAVMYLGKIVEITTKEQLFNQPLHPYTEALLSAVPIPDPTLRYRKNGKILEGELPSPTNPPSGCRFHTRCPYATDICKSEMPLLKEEKEEHFVACHFPLKEAVQIYSNM